MNIGFLGPAVATVLTVYGIETISRLINNCTTYSKLQQYLPFTVLKLLDDVFEKYWFCVATVLTLYGIETEVLLLLHMPNGYLSRNSTYHLRY